MKKFLSVMLAVVLVLACIAAVACRAKVRVALHVTDDLTKVYNLVPGQDLPTDLTNGDLVFGGWYYDKEFTEPVTSTSEVKQGTDFYAKWNPAGTQTTPEGKVTLTLDPNYDGASAIPYVLNKDAKFNLPPYTRTGYTLAGWFTEPVNGLQWTSEMPISADITLYAHWTQNGGVTPDEQVTLTLNLNYTGSPSPTSATMNKGTTYNLTTPTRTGYTFDGWYTSATGGTKHTGSITVNADTTLYAHWTQNGGVTPAEQVTVTLNLNYTGSPSPTSATINKGATYTLTTPTRNGYTFDGWYTSATGGTKQTGSITVNADTTLYAHWTENTSDVSVKEQFLTSVVSQPAANTNYYVAMYYALPDKVYYGTAQISGTKLMSTENKADATCATIEKTSGGFYIKLGTQYLSLNISGSSKSVTLTSNASTVFYVGENDILIATYNGDEYTIGSYQSGTNTTLYTYFGASEAKFSTGTNASKVDVTQFPIRLVTIDGSVAPSYELTIDNSKPLIVEVGAEIDYASYFTIADKDGNNVPVTSDMLNLSAADTSKEGTFTVAIDYENVSAQLTFIVVAQGTDLTTTPEELTEVFEKYADDSKWNFAVDLVYGTANDESEDYYEYLGENVLNIYTYDGEEYTEYLTYVNGKANWYYDNGDGTYDIIAEGSDDFDTYFAMILIDLTAIGNHTFIKVGDAFAAVNPNEAAGDVLGEAENNSWTSLTVYIANGNISKLVAVMNDGWTYTFTFSKHGQINFTLPNGSSSGGEGSGDKLPTEPTGVMDNQTYNEETFDNENLQDKMLTNDEAIGLPSIGEYNALVIPVQFSNNDNITTEQLAKLEKAFNGDRSTTGWESVKSFYEKSSYGNLKLSFNIQPVFNTNQTSTYYKSYKQNVNVGGETWTMDGSALILEQALAWCVNRGVDLSQYDHNNDGCIDAVYLIYSENVDYDDADFYWAYVTWYYGEKQFSGKDAYYYLFAGFDFMDENLDKMNGVTVNAETYIHETGHLLGLDDYYDYSENTGSDQGLGGADMMDYNVGDHGVYSKIMLGWITPEIITSTQTIVINSSQSQTGDRVILIPLNWNNSYFCEYLLIDLYTATGLNEMGASQTNTILYDGVQYGVRIYHVSSSINNPYGDDYGSFTDKNNSVSNIPLIKLVEADGETSSSTSGSWASESDLWQEGNSFSNVFPQYMRYDGKTLNFNITIGSVSAESATITITYNAD